MKSFLQKIGDYQILEKLGRGGMADVYLAANLTNNQRIALKLVEMGPGEEAREIVEAERLGAEFQRRLSMVDPRVPRIHACGELEGYLFIEMEFVEGSDLSTLIASRDLKARDAAGIALELCGILRNAHAMSLQIDGRELRAIVHGDIKPKNIRIDAVGKVRVLDFGIAKGLSVTRRLTSNVFGSAAYSSPERLDTGRIDEMSDLWSLGIVLYEMVEGRLPYEASNTEGLEATIRSHAAIRPLSDTCPFTLQQIIVKALNRFPSSRYQDAQSFESDLEAFLTGNTTLASRENEETRRTMPMESAEENETKRTAIGMELTEAPAQSRIIPPESILNNLKRRFIGAKKWIWAGGIAILLIVGIWEFLGDRAAFRLRSELVEGRLNADNSWDRYQNIRRNSPLGIASLILRSPIQKIMSESCERIFIEYRNSDVTRVREGDWVRCKKYMSRSVQLDPNNSKSRAMLEYADGHILRINRKDFDAVAAFQRASSLQPKWPDPYLGLARTFINNLGEMERGTQALDRARQLGISFGKRELALMAEAYRIQGLQAMENANLVQGTDREKESLKKAKSNFDEALKLYLQIAPWGNSTKQIPSIQDSLKEVDRKLAEPDQGNLLKPWNWF
jgi:eukaryotic-like serine/threonine-protein kinase